MIDEALFLSPSDVAVEKRLIKGIYSGEFQYSANINEYQESGAMLFRGLSLIMDNDLSVVNIYIDDTASLPSFATAYYPESTVFNTGYLNVKKYDWGYPLTPVSFQNNTLPTESSPIYTQPFYRMQITPANEFVAVRKSFKFELTSVPKGYNGVWGYILEYVSVTNVPVLQSIFLDGAKVEGIC